MNGTPRLALPFLSAGQAQKEVTYNEALQILDCLVAAAVEEEPRDDPPPTPGLGVCYLVGASPTGAWSGQAGKVAGYTSGGWRFFPPVEGMSLLVKSIGERAEYRLGAWEVGTVHAATVVIDGEQVIGARAAAITSPTGGSTTDSEARAAISAILDAMRQHGLIEP